jgi:hypothetical protein
LSLIHTASDESVGSDLTNDNGAKATDIDQREGEPMDMDVEQEDDSSGTADSSVTTDENTKDAEDCLLEVEESNAVADSTDEHHAMDEETDDVMDLEKLFGLLEQSKRAGDVIAGKNVMLLIGGTGAGKVRSACSFRAVVRKPTSQRCLFSVLLTFSIFFSLHLRRQPRCILQE